MKFELINVQTEQNIILPGMLLNNNNDKCIIYVPGLTGNFYESDFILEVAKICAKHKFDFIFSHNQGSFQIKDFRYLREDGKWKNKTIGATFETFKDSLYDIKAWIDYAKKINKKEIILIGHSRGCNKIVNYLSQYNDEEIKKVILLAPQDSSNFKKLDMHSGMYEEAQKNIKEGNCKRILSKPLLDFCYISSSSYLEIVDDTFSNNLPYKLNNGDFSIFSKNKKETLLVIGSKDGGEKSEEYMKEICKHSNNCKYKIVNEANHTFDNHISDLAKIIIDFI